MSYIPQLSWPTVESFQTIGGQLYRIFNGSMYTHPAGVFTSVVFDPNYIPSKYRTLGGVIYKYDSTTGEVTPLKRSYTENFSSFRTLAQALQTGTNFTNATLQGPYHIDVSLYNALKNRIVAGTSDFVDNRIDFVDGLVSTESWPFLCLSDRAGECCVDEDTLPKYARFLSVKIGEQYFLTKSSILNENLFYSKGDTVKIQMEVYLASGMIGGLIDLESDYISTSPGMRILCNPDGEMRTELKWGDKPTYRQSGAPTLLQQGVWTKIEFENYLHETTGTSKLKINDVLVIDGVGQTIPVPEAVYNRIEIGVTTNNLSIDCLLYIRNLVVTAT